MASILPLHMYIRPLILEDLDQVTQLESQGFPPEERASKENIEFRLRECPELCSGLFIREVNGTEIKDETLIGHIMGTKIPNNGKTVGGDDVEGDSGKKDSFITLESMSKVHDDSSNTIAIHSVVIAPEHQKKNLATLMLTDYIQKMSNQKVADRIVIIAHEPLVPFYERIGFQLVGENSDVAKDPKFARNKWCDMVRELAKEDYE